MRARGLFDVARVIAIRVFRGYLFVRCSYCAIRFRCADWAVALHVLAEEFNDPTTTVLIRSREVGS